MPITTTLNRIKNCDACAYGLAAILAHLCKTKADNEPLPFATIVKIKGLPYAVWCTQTAPEHAVAWRAFATMCYQRRGFGVFLAPPEAWREAHQASWGSLEHAKREALKNRGWGETIAEVEGDGWDDECEAQQSDFLKIVNPQHTHGGEELSCR